MKKNLQRIYFSYSRLISVNSAIRFFLLFIIFCPPFAGQKAASQPQPPFGNEWIIYTQKYLEFKISDTGIYRINYAALEQGLNSIGESIGSTDPRNIRIFGRGEEQYIYVEGENDGSFDTGDFIEFYATNNDGWLDSRLYISPADQSNPFYSLFNDTATYFLTVSPGTSGQRMGVVNFSSNGTPAPYFFKEDVLSFTNSFFQGEFYGSADGPALPLYKEGKGWFRNSINSGETVAATLNTSNAFTLAGAPDARLEIVLTGTNSNWHNLKISYGNSDTTDLFSGYLLRKYSKNIAPGNLSAGNFLVQVTSTSVPNPQTPDYTALSHIYFKYARNFNLSGIQKVMMALPASADSTLISVNGYPDTQKAYIYDLSSHKRIETLQSLGNNLQALVPPNASERKCYLFPANQIVYISTLKKVTETGIFNDYSADKDSAFVIITHPSLMDGAIQYNNYRNDINHESIIADIEQLYDQFAYGVNKHPLAIQNFCRFLLEKFTVPPQHLFIIGKGLSDAAFSTRNSPSLYAQNLVPTFGWPGSDIAFTWNIYGPMIGPAIPTGRLAARTNKEVLDYLEKVSWFEQNMVESEVTQTSIPEKIWMKHAIHFCGGNDASQGEQFCGFLQQYEDFLEKDLYGGYVTTIPKNSTVPVQVSLTDSIRKMIENGVSVMTFFGHSSSSYTDMSIGFASDYEFKKGRYPLMIVNGCFSGDIYTSGSESTSEDFILTEKKGAVGYIAHSGLGYTGELHNYTNNLYHNFAKKSYGKSIGQSVKQAISDLQPVNFIPVATSLGMTLHGDPAIKANTHLKPDYAIAPPYVYFSPTEVTTADDSFDVNVEIYNLGMASTDSVSVFLKRTFPNGTSVSYTRLLAPVFYMETVKFTLPADPVNGAGLNQFYIHVDEKNIVPEIAELNNIIGQNELTLNIISGDLIPVYPYNYAVVPNRNIVLKGSTSDPFASSKEYIFQIDTTDTYDSQKFQYFTTVSTGGVVKWNIDSSYFNLPDSTAFFWRTSPNNPADYHWREHTFQVIQGKTGWGQKHFFQFKNDYFSGIDYNRPERLFKFSQQQKGLRCDVWGYPQASIGQYEQTQYLIDGSLQDNGTATFSWPAIYIAIIDKCSLEPWGTKRFLNGNYFNPDNDFGNCNGSNGPHGRPWTVEKYFVFQIDDPVQMDSLEILLNNKIPDGNYVLAYSFGSGMFVNDPLIWTPSHIQAFKDLGADSIDKVVDPYPYIFFGQKGNPGIGVEKFGTTQNEFISLEVNMTGCVGKGTVTTPVIGPGKNWDELIWKFTADNSGGDTVKIEVVDAVSGTVLKNFNSFSGDIIPFNDSVNAADYPGIKLRATMDDDSLFTAAQLSQWYLLYDEIPEAALNQKLAFGFHATSIQQGDYLKFNIAIENVSNANMDSLRIRYWVENAQRNIDSLIIKKNGPLAAGSVMFDTVSFPTRNISGNCRFWIEVNPRDSLWQIEQYHFNNIASIGFLSEKDNTNPLLDVTFDGVRILNGDIVSPKPEIVIQLKDENKFLALNDTGAFRIFLKDPDQQNTRIYFRKNGAEQMRFSKAVLPDNKCKIEYQPMYLKDGIYELRVQGSDASGNDAGDLDYSITFEVINKSTITEILNYPNPFSTSTRFVFTLTGAEIPDYFKIQILTVSGKVIREITRSELGNIHIGRNITDFAWNGTDEYGDPLANGVYLYRVTAKINGESIEHRETNADPFFKKGFGKMYLMR